MNADIPVHQTFEERQSRLLQRWGFTCTCDLCNASLAERTATDERRREVVKWRDRVIDDFGKWKLFEAIENLKKMIQGITADPSEYYLVPLLQEPYESLARIFWILGDVRMAKQYVNQALDIKDHYIHLAARNRTIDLVETLKTFGALGGVPEDP